MKEIFLDDKILSSDEIFQVHSADLALAITTNLYSITNRLYSNNLISYSTKSDILTTMGTSDYTKSSKLVLQLQQHLQSLDSKAANDHLIKVCQVLRIQRDAELVELANSMLESLGKYFVVN